MTDSLLFTQEDIELLVHAEAQAEASDYDGSSATGYANLRRRIQQWLDQQHLRGDAREIMDAKCRADREIVRRKFPGVIDETDITEEG